VKIALEILANSMLTIPQISDNSGVSKRTVARYMKEFQDAGVLIREGSDTNGKWILV
jgi:predicted DNA-binding transcriptional regulator YafY